MLTSNGDIEYVCLNVVLMASLGNCNVSSHETERKDIQTLVQMKDLALVPFGVNSWMVILADVTKLVFLEEKKLNFCSFFWDYN